MVLSGGALLTGAGAAQEDEPDEENDGETDDESADVDTITCGETVLGALTEDDATGFRSDAHFHDEYEFEAEEGGLVAISMTALPPEGDVEDVDPDDPPGDPYLYLLGPDGAVLGEDDDSGFGVNAHLVVTSLPESGTYTILATSWGEDDRFEYELAVECDVEFDQLPIECGQTVVGELTPDDPTGYISEWHAYDTYGFEGNAGTYVEISMDAVEVAVDDDDPNEENGNEGNGGDEADDEDGNGTGEDGNGTGEDGNGNGDDGNEEDENGEDWDDEYDIPAADPLLILFGPDGEPIAWDDDSGDGLNARITTALLEDGTYTVMATSYGPEAYFAYDLRLDCWDPVEPVPIGCGETIAGELTEEDETGIRNDFGDHYHDTYSFEGIAGEYVTVTMIAELEAGNGGGYPLGDPYLYLFDPDGRMVAFDDDSAGGLDAMIQHFLPSDGEYVIVATSYWDEERFPYEVTLRCEDVEPPSTDPVRIGCGDVITEALDPTDATGFLSPQHFHDEYVFEGEQGQRVTISMSSSVGDTVLFVLDPDGDLAVFDAYSGGNLDALITDFDLGADGTYTVIATSFWPGETFDYNLTLQCW
ncbi:hypothetical protein GRS48_11590 [Halorubrum sp. JWXQ-INN 858]|uniref:PPC domain-containing protein n=1 Tax=Halorubrum sp. JWXQ-INN 858 TaxID=2690782 RepID=UPI00135CDAE5|nr:PPC domain-containing protein [Halorubrum sp. JWXQ-INN 858]MWV65454.1 hypothetical protein [Halorubrum sp. JWXQ-INN 858]